jgi:hypothetical protein
MAAAKRINPDDRRTDSKKPKLSVLLRAKTSDGDGLGRRCAVPPYGKRRAIHLDANHSSPLQNVWPHARRDVPGRRGFVVETVWWM